MPLEAGEAADEGETMVCSPASAVLPSVEAMSLSSRSGGELRKAPAILSRVFPNPESSEVK